jgi:hypothetical protein
MMLIPKCRKGCGFGVRPLSVVRAAAH